MGTLYEEEDPSNNVVAYYSIYDVVNGEPNHVMDVGNFTNVYAYDPDDFDGYGAVAAVFVDSKGIEEMSFSNMTEDILGINESENHNFKLYPNPSNGTFNVEGAKTLTIYNTIGQIIATGAAENGIISISITTPGIYFVKSDEGKVKKIVVE